MLFQAQPHSMRDALREAVSFLSKNGVENGQHDALVLLQHILKVDKAKLLLIMAENIEQEKLSIFNDLIRKRAQGVPLQYLTGEQEFMSLNFKVTPAVLIPRPETEMLVEKALELAAGFPHPPKIVDICTGSGCIIVSICYYFKKGIFAAGDLSFEALEIAKENAATHNVLEDITFLEADLLNHSAFKDADIIVSNPPYIPSGEIPHLQKEVANYEPKLALDGGDDGLEIYRRLIPQAYSVLKEEGWLLLEVGCDQAKAVSKIFRQNGFENIAIKQDLRGKDRMVFAQKKQR